MGRGAPRELIVERGTRLREEVIPLFLDNLQYLAAGHNPGMPYARPDVAAAMKEQAKKYLMDGYTCRLNLGISETKVWGLEEGERVIVRIRMHDRSQDVDRWGQSGEPRDELVDVWLAFDPDVRELHSARFDRLAQG